MFTLTSPTVYAIITAAQPSHLQAGLLCLSDDFTPGMQTLYDQDDRPYSVEIHATQSPLWGVELQCCSMLPQSM